MDISERFCPVCKNKNDREAIICVHCGATIETYSADVATTRVDEEQILGAGESGELQFDEGTIPVGGIAFYLEGASNPVFLSSSNEFVIGRKIDETSEAFLDLSAMGGYHLGLSRRHVMVRRAEEGYEVIDLASSNGTWLNGERLIPNQPYPLVNGSLLRLARMQMYVLYRAIPEPKGKT